MSKNVAAIICAAGPGSRFGGKRKKQFTDVAGRAVFVRSVELFANRDDVKQILLGIAEEDEDNRRHGYNRIGLNVECRHLDEGADPVCEPPDYADDCGETNGQQMADDGDGKGIQDIEKVSAEDPMTRLPDFLGAGDDIIGQVQNILQGEQKRQSEKVNDEKLVDAPMKHA